MKAVRGRFLLKALVVSSLIALQAGGVAAQIPDPTQPIDPNHLPLNALPDQAPTPEPPPPDPTQEVPPPVEEVPPSGEPTPEVVVAPEESRPDLLIPTEIVEAIAEAIAAEANEIAGGAGSAVGTGSGGETTRQEIAGQTSSPAETVENADAALGPDAVASVEESKAEVNPELEAAIVEVASEVEEAIDDAAAPGILHGEAAAADRGGGTRSLSEAQTIEAIDAWARSGVGILSGAGSIFGSAQPSFAILVDAMNDADGDGNFTDVEIASGPSVDVRFRALISNIGSTSFEIAGVSHTYEAVSGRAQVEVCEKLVGLVLPAGKSVPCAFSLAEYAPPRGESAVNTITAAAFEIGNSGRGASDSDTSTVDTLFVGEVLAVAVKREPGLLAFTGMDAAGLIVLAFGLLLAGATLSYVGRERRVAQQAALIGNDPWVELLQWVRAELAESRARQMVGSR